MWGSSSKSKSAKIETLVGRNTRVTGEMCFAGGMHVDGSIHGNVIADSEDCMISVSQFGVVEGDVKVPHIVLDGTVTGDVYATGQLELAANAKVNGNVYYNLIEMAVGASVNGKMVHQPAEQPLLLEQNREKTEASREKQQKARAEADKEAEKARQQAEEAAAEAKVEGGGSKS